MKSARCLMAGTKNHPAAVIMAAVAMLAAGCMADVEPGPVAGQTFGLTEGGTGAAPGCAGVGCSLSGSVTLSVEDGAVWMLEDGRPLCAGTMEEVQRELLAYEQRLQTLEREMIVERPANRNLAGDGSDPHDIYAPVYDPNPVPAGEANAKIQSFSSSSTSGGDGDFLKGPIPDPNPVPAVSIGIQIGSQDGASSSGDSDDEDRSAGPRVDLAMLTATLR
jgi:hypothetical protein